MYDNIIIVYLFNSYHTPEILVCVAIFNEYCQSPSLIPSWVMLVFRICTTYKKYISFDMLKVNNSQ